MTPTPEREALSPKLENIISGHRINDDDAAWLRALLAASPAAGGVQPPETVALIKECRDAFAEELAGFDIDPPIHHVKQAHDRCAAWLAATPPAAPAQAKPQGAPFDGEQYVRDWADYWRKRALCAEDAITLAEAENDQLAAMLAEEAEAIRRSGESSADERRVWMAAGIEAVADTLRGIDSATGQPVLPEVLRAALASQEGAAS